MTQPQLPQSRLFFPRMSDARSGPTCVISAVLSWTGMVPSAPAAGYWGSCCCR